MLDDYEQIQVKELIKNHRRDLGVSGVILLFLIVAWALFVSLGIIKLSGGWSAFWKLMNTP